MKQPLFFISLFAILLGIPNLNGNAQSASNLVRRENDIIQSVSRIDWDAIINRKDQLWFVGLIQRDKEPIVARPLNAFKIGPDGKPVRGPDGKIIFNPHAPLMITVHGACNVLVRLNANNIPDTINYTLIRHAMAVNRDRRTLLLIGGRALVKYNPDAQGEELFDPWYEFPEGWIVPLKAAWPILRRRLAGNAVATPDDVALLSPNPILSLVAFDQRKRTVGADVAAKLVQHPDPILRAVYAYYFLMRGNEEQQKEVVAALGSVASTGEGLDWLATGIWAAVTQDHAVQEGVELVQAMNYRLQAAPPTEAAKTVEYIEQVVREYAAEHQQSERTKSPAKTKTK